MTGYTVHTGSTEKFAAGWDAIFKQAKRAKSVGTKKHAAAKQSRTRAAASKGRKMKRRK